jgi:hypothetical protein
MAVEPGDRSTDTQYLRDLVASAAAGGVTDATMLSKVDDMTALLEIIAEELDTP